MLSPAMNEPRTRKQGRNSRLAMEPSMADMCALTQMNIAQQQQQKHYKQAMFTQMMIAQTQQHEQDAFTQMMIAQHQQHNQQTQALVAATMTAMAQHTADQQQSLWVQADESPPPGLPPGLSPPGVLLPSVPPGLGMSLRQHANSSELAETDASPTKRTPAVTQSPKAQVEDGPASLRCYLEKLKDVDNKRVFTARRINKLGFKSKGVLQQYFSQYGEVTDVFVTHPTTGQHDGREQSKTRPGNLGIVVMKSVAVAERIIADGAEHVIRKVPIRVAMYEPKAENEDQCEQALIPESAPQPKLKSYSGGGADDFMGATADLSFESLQMLQQMLANSPLQASQWDVAQGLREQADRLRAEADAILAVAQSTSPIAVPTKMAATGYTTFHPAMGMHGPTTLQSATPSPQSGWGGIVMQPMGSPPGLTQQAAPECSQSTPDCKGTLSAHLMQVSSEDPACVFTARHIHKLGFQAPKILRQHFSQYGVVLRVLVADKKVIAFPGSTGQRKTRPGGLGLVVMKSAGTVKSILAAGAEQVVDGHAIVVQPYEGPKTNSLDDTSTHATSQGASGGSRKSQQISNDSNDSSGHGTRRSKSGGSQEISNDSNNSSGGSDKETSQNEYRHVSPAQNAPNFFYGVEMSL